MGVKDFWPSFSEGDNLPEIVCDGSGSVACKVLSSFGVPYAENFGGSLENLDIKHMEALEAIKLSLLQASAELGDIFEMVFNHEDGKVEFKRVGGYNGINGDIYYQIQTGTYKEDCTGVMVTGGKPLDKRLPPEWKPIWSRGLYGIFDTSFLVSSCVRDNFCKQATIVFNDPHLDSKFEDGIDNLYEINRSNPWDEIIGYAYFIDPGPYDPDLQIIQQNTATILLRLKDGRTLGTLAKRPVHSNPMGENPACFEGSGMEPTDGVELEIPEIFRYETIRGNKVDKFKGVVGVYVVGREISYIFGKPLSDAQAIKDPPDPGDAEIFVGIEKTYDEVFKLDLGSHYAVLYEGSAGNKIPKISFVNNGRLLDPIMVTGSPQKVYVDPACSYYVEKREEAIDDAVILPTSLTQGILVKEIMVAIELDTPSIVVSHPNGTDNKARKVAEELDYQIAPLVVRKEPAPIAFNGKLINLTDGIADHDPTTTQNFTDTDFERAIDMMATGGGGEAITLSFLDSNGVVKMSDALYDYLNSGDGTETTFVCGPDTKVAIGGTAPNGGVVNNITYSYQDSQSYTISVNAGAKIVGGLGNITGGPSFKVTENVTSEGVVIEDMGNHIFYKVMLNQVGVVVAVNSCPNVIRVGDVVQCSIYNNPVES